jgi:hypothetical protein
VIFVLKKFGIFPVNDLNFILLHFMQWMQLGNSPVESMLPPRFERLYQPEKMAQFDRFFARSWATPVRRSHSAQHSGDGDEQLSEFRRSINVTASLVGSSSKHSDSYPEQGRKKNDLSTLEEFISSHGFESIKRPTLRRFVQEHDVDVDVRDDEIKSSRADLPKEGSPSYLYLGDTNRRNERIRDEYVQCAKPSESIQPSLFNSVAFDDFKECLNGMSLNANDVLGIKNLAESGYVGRQVKSGPYKGLHKDFSAIEVSTVVFEQLNAYENIRSRGELLEGIPVMDSELKRRGFYTDGVKDAIVDDWDRYLAAEKQYNETCLSGSTKFRRSDLTTTNSLKLYTSFFSPDQAMTITDLSLLGETVTENEEGIKPDRNALLERASDFVSRASEKGISITSHQQLARTRSRPLYQFGRQVVPAGFEMINEDMFSRKDNKFMVFNGPGVDTWTDTKPITKISGIQRMLSTAIK